ncbi:MAG: DNA polymerase III subunit delta [Burkholderiaceae bacterium]
MQLRLDPLKPGPTLQALERLTKGPKPPGSWAVCGDDPLLTQEATDAIRRLLSAEGFGERISATPDRSFDWKSWIAEAAAPSLFSQRRLLEVRLPTGKPGLEGAKRLGEWAERPAPETVLLLHLPRLDKALANSSWMTKIAGQGVVVMVDTVGPGQMSRWLEQRLADQGLRAGPGVLSFLAERFEGNLAAAHQDILKLGYLPRAQPEAPLDLSEVQALVTDQARFSPFQLGELLCADNPRRAIRVLRGLKEEGEPLPLILWSAAQACRRLSPNRAGEALRELSRIDTMVKGLSREDPWLALERLALHLGGAT